MKNYSIHHHAHIIELNGNELERAVVFVEEQIMVLHKGEHCFAHRLLFNSLKTAQAREISSATENKNTQDERRIFLIGFHMATREAQNTLLKTLEEPPVGTSFVLLVPSSDILLKTIQSRCISLTLEQVPTTETSFLKSSYKERLERVKTLLENKELVGSFYAGLEREINHHISSGGIISKNAKVLSLPLEYKSALMNHSSSSKYLLEEIALTMPLISP
jgi:DNA polymerase III delta prime subunit